MIMINHLQMNPIYALSNPQRGMLLDKPNQTIKFENVENAFEIFCFIDKLYLLLTF